MRHGDKECTENQRMRDHMAKTFEDRIEELDIEELIKKEKEHDTKECCHKCFIPLMEHRKTNWDILTQTSKLTCPECGFSKRLKKTTLN